jgi:hypothetical protein
MMSTLGIVALMLWPVVILYGVMAVMRRFRRTDKRALLTYGHACPNAKRPQSCP